MHDQSLKCGIEKGHILERTALLEVILGRSLARSGSAAGYEVLIEYLDDMRAVLAEFAHGTLVKITGKDFGKNKTKWTEWLNTIENRLEPVALNERPFG